MAISFKTFKLALSAAICILAVSSCQRENMPVGSIAGKIRTQVSANNPLTKASVPTEAELIQTLEMDMDGLFLKEYVSNNLSQPFGDSSCQTRGTTIMTGNIAEEYGVFGVEGFLDNFSEIDCPEGKWPRVYVDGEYTKLGNDHYVTGGKSTYSSSTWTLTDGSGQEYPWLNSIDFTFWSYAPTEHSGTFAYEAGDGKPRGKMTITGYEIPTSAEAQKDLLVACNAHNYPTDGEVVDILFRHALADIFFDVTPISNYGLTVNEITISGANSKGDCKISSTDLYEKVEAGFNWTSKTPVDFTMSGAADHFFMIPQNFSGTITISLSNGKTLTTALATNWLAGKYYTYKLTYNGIEISVDDDVNGNVKENVVIKSTAASTVKCYIRALIIGNWHQNLGTDSEPVPGAILAPWSLSDGTFEGLPATVGSESGSHWVLGSDGFYYYKYPVYPNRETGKAVDDTGTADKLFGKYTAPQDAPIAGTYLNLSIIAQAVKWDADKAAAKKAWGETAAGYLSATDKGSN